MRSSASASFHHSNRNATFGSQCDALLEDERLRAAVSQFKCEILVDSHQSYDNFFNCRAKQQLQYEKIVTMSRKTCR